MPLSIDDITENNSDGCRQTEYNECQAIDGISSCCLRQQDFAVVLYYETRRIMLSSCDENTETRASLLEALQGNPQTPTSINDSQLISLVPVAIYRICVLLLFGSVKNKFILLCR